MILYARRKIQLLIIDSMILYTASFYSIKEVYEIVLLSIVSFVSVHHCTRWLETLNLRNVTP